MSLGKKFIHAALSENNVSSLLTYGKIDHLFRLSELPVYEFVRDFVSSYHKLPSEETILAHTGEELSPATEPAAYYHDLMQLRYQESTMKKAMKDASDLFLPENKNISQALEVLTSTVLELATAKLQRQVVDFREAHDVLMADYAAKWDLKDGAGLQLGWPTLDAMSGGFVKGDVLSIVGRPSQGKSWQMLYAAHHGWNAAKKAQEAHQSRLFVSMEMGLVPVQQRLAAMQAHIPASQLKHASLSSKNLKKLKEGLVEIQDYGDPFWIVDGNLAATVEDIWALARQLNPDAIFIDGGYLVKHPTERDRYRRVAENAELIKSELSPLAPTVCSWQFAKTASNKSKKKGEKVTYDDIGYTDAIAQVSSLVVGLFEEESVETLNRRKNEILKGRNGETGSFITNWNFQTMDFSEVEEQDVSELQFL